MELHEYQASVGYDSLLLLVNMNTSPGIPVVDFEPFLRGSPQDRRYVASTIDIALSTVGFMYLVNYGID